jgi:hypothetical protein
MLAIPFIFLKPMGRMTDYTNAYNQNTSSPGGGRSQLFTIIILVLAAVALYYLYNVLTKNIEVSDKVILVKGKQAGNVPPEKIPKMPTPFEGGEYTFTTWIYINSFNTNMNRRKHIFEIHGTHFSTLLVALGAFKNTLVVRTHNKDVESFESFQGAVIPKMVQTGAEGFQATPGTSDAAADGDLSAKIMDEAIFKSMTSDDSLLNPTTMCDLPEIDMQRWVMVTVVLNGRTIDVYLDGKLARSCVTKSYYKVDPTGQIKPLICERGGFDGYISNMAVANYAMNPDEIYRAYISGPEGATLNPFEWLKSLFTGSEAK